MPTITMDLDAKTDEEIGEEANAIFEAMDGKAKYASVQALVTALGTAKGAYSTALTDQVTKDAIARAATQTKKDKRELLEAAISGVAAGLTAPTATFTDADVLEAKFSLRAAPTAIGQLPAPVDFLATMGDEPGEMDLVWAAIKGRRVYDVEYRLNVEGATWTRVDPSPTKSKMTVTGLQSGKEYVFRVRAVGTAGAGPWNDVNIKMAP